MAKSSHIKNYGWRLPWWLSGKEATYQCRRHRFDPWSRRNPHAAEQLSPCTTTTEPVLQSPGVATTEFILSILKPMLLNKRAPQWEACAPQLEQLLLVTTGEKPTQQWRPSTAKNKNKTMDVQKKKINFHLESQKGS